MIESVGFHDFLASQKVTEKQPKIITTSKNPLPKIRVEEFEFRSGDVRNDRDNVGVELEQVSAFLCG